MPTSPPSSPADRHHRLDALSWLLVPALALAVLPNGYVSADGLGQSLAFSTGRWHLNPNHLLFDPLAAGWIGLWKLAGCHWHPADVLKVLSGVSGALALALFRLLVAPRLAATRWLANQATAYVAFSSAFLRLWVSDEVQMVQMPAVVLVMAVAIRRLEEDRRGLSLLLGLAVGLAALCFVSNALLGVTLAAAVAWRHLARRQPRRAAASAAAIAAGMTLAAAPPLLGAWLARAHGITFFEWLTRYDGGASSTRVAGAYGLVTSTAGVLTALVRSLYGAASSLVDLAAPAALVRDRETVTLAALIPALAFAAAVVALAIYASAARGATPNGRPASAPLPPLLPLALAWVAAVVAFGVFWDNSDDQFYFQLAPIFGAIAASVPASRLRHRATSLAMALGAAALLWDVGTVATQRLLYPRSERVALIEREVAGACLVVVPGFDEAQLLLALSPRASTVSRLSLVELAVAEPPATGLPRLRQRIDACLVHRGRVVLLDVFATPRLRAPWKYLLRLGYERRAVEAALAGGTPTRRSGPFTVREIRPPPAGSRRAPGSSPASPR